MNQSNENEEYEFILGNNGQKEYYVKVVNEPYCRSKWISKETLLNSPNGEDLISRYLHSTNHKTNPPFYNEEYDIQERIIQKKDNLYLVKWTHLFYDHLTWEKKVDKSLLTLFRIRNSAHFPKKLLSTDFIFSDETFQITKESIFYQNMAGLPFDIVEEVNFLINEIRQNDIAITEIDINYRSIISTSVFIHWLAQKMADFGPFLIVIDQREFNDWYDYLNKSKELTTIAYNGPIQSRKTIHEIEFIDDDNTTLKFHILITIPHILEEDIEYLQQIEWKFAFIHYFNDASSNAYSNITKTLNKLRIMRKIVFHPIDKKSVIPNAQAISAAFESNTLKDSTNSPACENFFQFVQKSKIPSISKVESTYFYIVECPMSDIQKKVCKYILSENISLKSPEKSNFFIITRLFYYVIQHPFIIPGIESKLLQENVLFASTKMRVMRRIIYDSYIDVEESDIFPNILICTQIPEMYNIIKDFLDETYSEDINIQVYLNTEFKPLNNSNSNQNLSSNSSSSNLYLTEQISFKTIDVAIIYDGKLKQWEKLLDAKITQSTRIYKLEALDSREIEIKKSPSSTDEEICKTISLQIMIPTGDISPRELLEENISFDMIKKDPHSSTFAVNSFVGNDFWQNFVKMPEFSLFSSILDSEKPLTNIDTKSSTDNDTKKKAPKNKQNISDEQQQPQNYQATISLYQRRQFSRSLISFGWGNWPKIINSIGLDINEEMCKKLVLTVFSLIKYESEKNKYKKDKKAKTDKKEKKTEYVSNFISNLYRDFLLQTKTDNIPIPKSSNLNPNNFKDLLRNDKFLLTAIFPSDFFERILQLSCLSHFFDSNLYDENDINSFDFTYLQCTKPGVWWTDEHDRALLYGMWKYGLGNYIPFIMKEEQDKDRDDDEEEERSENLYEKLLKEIILSELNLNTLNKREIDLLSFITSYILDDLRMKNNNIQKTLPNWTDEEQELVINYLLSYGINFNSLKEINEIAAKMVNDGTAPTQQIEDQVDNDDQNEDNQKEEEDQKEKEEDETNQPQIESESKENNENDNDDDNNNNNNNENDNDNNDDADDEDESDESESDKIDIFSSYQLPHQTQKSISDFLQLIKKEMTHPSPDEGGFSLITTLKLRMRINAMKFLHNYVLHVHKDQLYYFYKHVPKWRIGDYNISDELEHIFLRKIERKGFGKLNLILSNPVFSGITDIQILTLMKDEYKVILRINQLSQIAQKKDLFAHEPSTGEDEFEKLFGLTLPLSISSSYIVHSFGKICPNKPAFHNDRYIYPIGFKTSRLSPSILNAGVKARWYSEILNVNETPLFRVWQDGVPDASFEGATATAAWVLALRTVKHDNNVSVSGPDSFLLTNPIVVYFLQKMPGASKCKNYKMRNNDSHPQVLQFLKANSLMSSDNEEEEK